MVKCCIGIGKCSTLYKYLLGCIFFNTIKEIIKDFCPVLKGKQLMQTISKNFGYLFFGIIFFFVSQKKNKRNTNIKISNDKLKEIKEDDRKYTQLIYNDIRHNIKISEIDKYTLFLVAINYVIYYEFLKILYYLGYKGLEFWTFDIFFLFIFTYFYFPKSIYKHQIISMIFIIIINTYLLMITSFDRIILNDNTNQYENIYENKGFKLCLFMIIIYIDISFLIAYARVKEKIFMDNKFISPYKIIILIGIFGLFYNLIIFLFFIIKGSNTICQNSADRENIYCFGETDYFYKLFDKDNKLKDIFIEITCTLIYIFFHFLALIFELLTIKYLNQNFILIKKDRNQ